MNYLGQLTVSQIRYAYDATRKWFLLVSSVLMPANLVINAPFGRFTPESDWLTFDGRVSWFFMEIVSPVMFTYNLLSAPLAQGFTGSFNFDLTTPQLILAACYIIHYANRAIISPLTTPSRSRAHLIVPLFGVSFNVPNGFLMGSYLSSPSARAYLSSPKTFSRTSFWIGLGLWAVGFAGNIVHDEILANIRRKANRNNTDKKDDDGTKEGKRKEHYAIPHGLLYEYISFPNYFCEWIEWFGFALAASPFPFSAFSLASISHLTSPTRFLSFLVANPTSFAPYLTPPYVFLINEILLMFPRAYKGQLWYRERFGEAFPKERKIVVPFVL